MLASLHGMGADAVLSIQLVLANGTFITASPDENTDLFWAVRGGGGSTFGVVSSMVVKAFPDLETTVGTVEWSLTGNNITEDIFWAGISSYFSYFPEFTAAGTAASTYFYPTGALAATPNGTLTFQIAAFLAPGLSTAETIALTDPWVAEMSALGLPIAVNWTTFDSYHTAYYSVFPPTAAFLFPPNFAYASRLVPAENYNPALKLNETVAVYRDLVEGGHTINTYVYAPTLLAGLPVAPNAVLPAWRDALTHNIIFVEFPTNSTPAEQLPLHEHFANVEMAPIREITPDSGCYLNEADILEPDWQETFYGVNYERLVEVKRGVDPGDVFYF